MIEKFKLWVKASGLKNLGLAGGAIVAFILGGTLGAFIAGGCTTLFIFLNYVVIKDLIKNKK